MASWTVPPVFSWLQESGRVPGSDMMRTFNMGVGLIVATAADKVDEVKASLGGFVIGDVVSGEPSVTYL
jgi:phosphoribosylformylglycinamidine cyclo-ligase